MSDIRVETTVTITDGFGHTTEKQEWTIAKFGSGGNPRYHNEIVRDLAQQIAEQLVRRVQTEFGVTPDPPRGRAT